MIVDWRGISSTATAFQKRKGPNGTEYFEVRETSGYRTSSTSASFGELVVQRPSYCGIILRYRRSRG